MKACVVFLLGIGLVSCLAKENDLTEKEKRFILTFASSACSDSLDNCAAYPKSVCSDPNYQAWAKDNCKSYCNLCSSGSSGGGTPPLPDTSSGCSDKLSDCSAYDPSACQNYQQWAQDNCANTCNMCSKSSGGGGGGATGNGGGFTGSSSGCVYNGQLYQQGQTWKDACKYNCECVDGTSGKYQCSALCLTWNLPSSCHMNPPGPGKCCPQPACPPSITLQYPPGYTPQ
ncbi:CCN family member 2-like [Mercenaria mercenaria]|uniref:CCN family member 2-like n=1 Tax=Mercenaria mercenaria TaxID=6596 RepID=UPI00234F7D53|nr:CCN family member 2-like [Mercenaria mercenaria]